MCIYLVYRIRKWHTGDNARTLHTPEEESPQVKQDPLCEHQLAHGTEGSNEGMVGGDIQPNPGHKQPPPMEQAGSKHCPACTAEKKSARVYRWKVIVSLLIPNIMASMDLTIVATALPTIASHFCQ